MTTADEEGPQNGWTITLRDGGIEASEWLPREVDPVEFIHATNRLLWRFCAVLENRLKDDHD